MAKQVTSPTRDEKLENLILNHSLIFMGMFEEALSDIAEKITEAVARGGAAMVDALGGMSHDPKTSGGAEVAEKLKGMTPELRNEIAYAFSGIREEVASQWPKNAAVFKRYISSLAFDKGIEIVESYDFGRPKLTQKLSDEALTSYVFLVKSGDPKIAKMLKELAEWQSGLPKPPWVG